jgi:hypothetical protein
MAPEYGATCGFFPIDQKTIDSGGAQQRDQSRPQALLRITGSRLCGSGSAPAVYRLGKGVLNSSEGAGKGAPGHLGGDDVNH